MAFLASSSVAALTAVARRRDEKRTIIYRNDRREILKRL